MRHAEILDIEKIICKITEDSNSKNRIGEIGCRILRLESETMS